MYLNKEEEKMLKGEMGPDVELAMEVIVKMGDALKAERLIPTTSSHIGNSGFLRRMESYLGMVRRFLEVGARVKVPTSENTYPYDPLREELIPEVFRGPNPLAEWYRKLGVTPTWTCTPYNYGNIPRFGQHISWEESSAVVYVNSVLGAKTNRETITLDLTTAIAGRTLYRDLHIDKNRQGEVLFTVNKKPANDDYPAMGYFLGKTVGTKIPVIQGLPRNVPASDLKNMGAAAASTGAVALYHVVDVTPEAVSLERAFAGERPVDRIQMDSDEFEMTKEEMSAVSEGEKVEVVGLGCPHYSLEEVASAARMLEGKKIKEGVQLWICTHEAARTLAKELGYHDIIEASGARLITGCPLNLCIVPPYSEMSAMSDSGKFCYYRRSAFGSQEQCIKSAIAGRVMK